MSSGSWRGQDPKPSVAPLRRPPTLERRAAQACNTKPLLPVWGQGGDGSPRVPGGRVSVLGPPTGPSGSGGGWEQPVIQQQTARAPIPSWDPGVLQMLLFVNTGPSPARALGTGAGAGTCYTHSTDEKTRTGTGHWSRPLNRDTRQRGSGSGTVSDDVNLP